MAAKPFDPKMGRARRPVHGATQALGLAAVLVCSAWAGAHGLGAVIGWVLAVLAVTALVVGLVAAWVCLLVWAWRSIDDEVHR